MSAGSASPRPRDSDTATDDTAVPYVQRIATRTVYRNSWMSVREDDVRRSDGGTGIYGVVDRPLGVVVVPRRRDSQGNAWLYLVEQFRYPVGARRWELPAGTVDDGTVDAVAIAERELHEETGLTAGRLRVLSTLDVAPGFTAQQTAIVLAENLSDGSSCPEPTETDMRGQWWSAVDIQRGIANGTIVDAQTLAALACVGAQPA